MQPIFWLSDSLVAIESIFKRSLCMPPLNLLEEDIFSKIFLDFF